MYTFSDEQAVKRQVGAWHWSRAFDRVWVVVYEEIFQRIVSQIDHRIYMDLYIDKYQ
jgi:hypothetical protein